MIPGARARQWQQRVRPDEHPVQAILVTSECEDLIVVRRKQGDSMTLVMVRRDIRYGIADRTLDHQAGRPVVVHCDIKYTVVFSGLIADSSYPIEADNHVVNRHVRGPINKPPGQRVPMLKE